MNRAPTTRGVGAILGGCGSIRIRTRFLGRRVRRKVCRRLFLAGFLPCLRLLPVAFGIRGRGRRLLRKVSWRHRERVAGFRGGGLLLRDGLASAQNRASWGLAVRAFLVRVDSPCRPVSFGLYFCNFISVTSFLALRTEIGGADPLLTAFDQVRAAAAWFSFAAVDAEDFFQSLEPPLRVAKIRPRMQTAF